MQTKFHLLKLLWQWNENCLLMYEADSGRNSHSLSPRVPPTAINPDRFNQIRQEPICEIYVFLSQIWNGNRHICEAMMITLNQIRAENEF